eukprot:7222928-Pyramimonas_sp.AAC.1
MTTQRGGGGREEHMTSFILGTWHRREADNILVYFVYQGSHLDLLNSSRGIARGRRLLYM